MKKIFLFGFVTISSFSCKIENTQINPIPLTPITPTVVSKTGRIWMDRNLGAL